MYILDYENLLPGDIVLVKGDSERIRKLTKSDYSHAFLFVSNSSCIESDGLGVQSFNPQRKLFDNVGDAIVLRLVNVDNRESIIDLATKYARNLVGTEYGTSEARKVVTGMQDEVELNKQYCTRLITQSYDYGGIQLTDNILFPSPNDIIHSTLLEKIDGIREALEKEIEYAKTPTPLDLQVEAINKILETARNLTNGKVDIQTFNQLDEYLLEARDVEFDKMISAVLMESGFLNLWKIEEEKNPQHYNFDEFEKYYQTPDQIFRAACFLYNELNSITPHRYYINRYGYYQYYQEFPAEYFKLHIELYENLVSQLELREDVLRQVLDKYFVKS